MKKYGITTIVFLCFIASSIAQISKPWSVEKANKWYAEQNWLLGANFVPSTAINQLEMWQKDTFDPTTIDRELGWASDMGMNSMRVFLHDLVFENDPKGFVKRIDQFLEIANKHHIKIMFVFFDSVWDPHPYIGKQRAPRKGVHNSGWMQSPGVHALQDSTQYKRLENYVKTIVKRYSKDKRVLCWDIWNEPDNMNGGIYNSYEPVDKVRLVTKLLISAFSWARSQNPIQPLTSYICGSGWQDRDISPDPEVQKMVYATIEASDIISFHNYNASIDFERIMKRFLKYGRPVLCTEFLARGNGSTFEDILPIAKQHNVGMFCWGLVMGKTNTIYDWGSIETPQSKEPKIWHHDVLRQDGKPFSVKEYQFLKSISSN